jgi:hypothetical protein
MIEYVLGVCVGALVIVALISAVSLALRRLRG